MDFGLTAVTTTVTTQGTMNAIQVDRIDQNHPSAPPGIQTGRYWNITPSGSGEVVNLTLFHNNVTSPQACYYLGSGTNWDCAANSSTSSTVTRNGVTAAQLNGAWAVGAPTPTNTPTPTPVGCVSYTRSFANGVSIVPGTVDIGNHGDDVVTTINLPFAFSFYGQSFSSTSLSSNGNLQFLTTDNSWTNQPLPFTNFNYAILPHWDDLRTDDFTYGGEGIFTSTTGVAPNRIFNIEWQAERLSTSGFVNFEIRSARKQRRDRSGPRQYRRQRHQRHHRHPEGYWQRFRLSIRSIPPA